MVHALARAGLWAIAVFLLLPSLSLAHSYDAPSEGLISELYTPGQRMIAVPLMPKGNNYVPVRTSSFVRRKHHDAPKPPHPSNGSPSQPPPKKKSIGQKIKEAFHKFGQKVKAGFKKFGQKVKAGFQKVGHWLKETGAKIVKVALKVAAVVHKVIAKVVGWIPGIGKPLGRALELSSKGLNAASNAIHVKLPGKLDTAMHRMDKGLKVMSYIP